MAIKVDLTKEQHLYLQRILDCLRSDNQWPTYRALDQWFTYYHRDLDIEDIWKSLPQGLTNHMDLNQPESRATLIIPAIYQLENNSHALTAFLEILKLCVNTYMHFPTGDLTISSEKLLQDDPLAWNIAVRQGGLLLAAEFAPRIWKTFYGPDADGHWSCILNRQVRRFRDVTTIEEYLEKRDPPSNQVATLEDTTAISNGVSQQADASAAAMKKRISDVVVNAITDPKIKQICAELNNTPDENVFSLAQCIGEALKWTLWYQAQKFGTSMTASTMKMSRLLDDAINSYYSGNATVKFLKDFKYGFLKTGYDMVRHDPVYIPNSSALGPAIDVLEHILKETFSM